MRVDYTTAKEPVISYRVLPGDGVLRYNSPSVNNHQQKSSVYCTFLDSAEHRYRGHPESPQRLSHMMPWIDNPPFPEIQWLEIQAATEGEVGLIHSAAMLSGLKAACLKGTHEIDRSPSYVTEQSYQAALAAAGAALTLSRHILAEGSGRGFAIVRPPGHHAEPDASMGFCLINNIAVAAADAVASGLVKKVAIIDLDAHHGNGTQAAFWQTSQMGYLSTHEVDIYPGSGQMDSAPHARGRIINIPLPAFSGNSVFTQVLNRVIEPWVAGFQPEMIMVSAGFDAHFSDPLTNLMLDTSGFHQLTQGLIDLSEIYANGRLMYVLEGGYDPIALRDNIQACLAAMCGRDEYPDRFGKSPNMDRSVAAYLDQIQTLHHLKEK